MPEAHPTVCITCSLPLGEPLRLNRLRNGQVCPTCRDRVLDALPPALPSAPVLTEPSGEVDPWAMGDARDDAYGAGPSAAG